MAALALADTDLKPAWHDPARAQTKRPSVSVVVCCAGGNHIVNLERQLREQFAAHALEIIAVREARSMAEGYNRGASRTRGDVLLSCLEELEILQGDFGMRRLGHLSTCNRSIYVTSKHSRKVCY